MSGVPVFDSSLSTICVGTPQMRVRHLFVRVHKNLNFNVRHVLDPLQTWARHNQDSQESFIYLYDF